MKYSSVPALKVPPGYSSQDHVLVIYSNEESKGRVIELLRRLGVKETFWKYEIQTLAEYKEQGKLEKHFGGLSSELERLLDELEPY